MVSQRITRRAAFASVGVTVASLGAWKASSWFTGYTPQILPVASRPIRLNSYPPPRYGWTSEELVHLVDKRLCQVRHPQLGFVLHQLRILATPPLDSRYSDRLASAIAGITDSRQLEIDYREMSPIRRTPYGVRYVAMERDDQLEWGSRVAHAYQTLAVLGELGVPLDTAVELDQSAATLQDVLNDCLASLLLKQATRSEIEWAALAIALYLPALGRREWTNRWGTVCTIDALVTLLIENFERPERRPACLGTHLFNVLVVFHQVNNLHNCLSPLVANSLRETIVRRVRALVDTQRPDGSWGKEWHGFVEPNSRRARESANDQLLVTGHLLESLMTLPVSEQPPQERLTRAMTYLVSDLVDATDATILQQYCPYSHVGRCLLLWSSDPREGR